MSRRRRIATVVGALGAGCLLLLPLAMGAGAATPQLQDYQTVGFARGLTFTFSFRQFVLEKILDVGVPHAATELGTSAGGAARAEAAQVFPGDVVAGAAPGALGGIADGLSGAPPPFSTVGGAFPRSIPGYSLSYYPPGQTSNTDTVSGLLKQPVSTSAGPLAVENSRIQTAAHLTDASAAVTSNGVLLSNGATPVIDAASVQSTSIAKANGSIVTHTARTAIHDLTLTLSPGLIVKVGGLVTQATTSSDGSAGNGNASITVSDVRVISGSNTYSATIDGTGIHVTGLIPAEVPGSVPGSINTNLGQQIDSVVKGITDSGISIRTAQVFESVNGASSEASVGGLIIGFTGGIPRLPPAPDVVAQVIRQFVDSVKTYCPSQDKSIPPPFDAATKQLPVCVSPQLIPGPGTGIVTTVSLGSVDSLSAASTSEIISAPPLTPPNVFTPGTGSFVPGTPGSVGSGAGTAPPSSTTPFPRTQLFGLVARMPSQALIGSGLGFLVVAALVAMGPSLRRRGSAI